MSRSILVALGLSAILAGCATPFAEARRRVEGDRDHAVVTADSTAEAFPLAIAHCGRFGRSATYAKKSEGSVEFRCVDH